MTSVTPNIGLTVFNATGDTGVTFLNFRNYLAQDTSSNMTIIDTEIQAVIDSIAGLSSGAVFRVSATETSSGVYSNGAVSGFPVAYANGILISLSLDVAVPGASTLNINSIGAKSLTKYNTAGTLVNLSANDLMINKINLFTYSTAGSGQWIWMNATAADQLNVPSGVSGNFLSVKSDLTMQDSGSKASDFAVSAKGVTNGDTHDHIGGDGNPIVEGALSLSDITTANASTSAHGLVVKATAPASNILNVVGIANGETAYTNKSIFDSTAPAAIGTAAAGTSLIAAHRDHVHAGDHVNLSNIGTNTHAQIDTYIGTTAPATFAPIAKGVTNGDTHDHVGGDGATITYSSVSGTPTLPSGAIVGTSDTQTLSSKRIDPRVNTVSSSSSITINGDTTDLYTVTALAVGTTFNIPSGTPVNGQKLILRIRDNGTARTIAWNAIFRAIGVTLPSTTTISKTLYVGLIYNITDTKWDALAVANE